MTKILDDDVKKTIGRKIQICRFLFSAVLLVSFAVLSGTIPQYAHAAGLGKITVFSVLGQPLRAEVEIMATRDELVNMNAQLAPEEAFKQMGLDYPRVLSEIEFNVAKRPNGQPIIKLSTLSPVNDPFIDMLLELSWPKGRIVREYTFLLDPQEPLTHRQEPAQVVSSVPEVSSGSRNSRISNATRERAVKSASADTAATFDAPAPSGQLDDGPADVYQDTSGTFASSPDRRTFEVKEGDTLYKVAREVKPEGVSLDRVLLGLFRANQKAFEGKNIHRIRSGQVLSIPDRQEFEKISSKEARRVVAQSSNWGSYRNTLAGIAKQSPAQEGQGRQGAAGKITPKVEDKAAAIVDRKDRVKVSPTRLSQKGNSSKWSEEDRIAKEKALSEASERITALEKRVSDLQNLIAMKDSMLAEREQRAKQASQSASVQTPQPAATQQVAPPAPPPPQQVATPQPTVVARPPAPQPPRPAVPPRKPVVPPPPPEDPGIIDTLLDNWILIAGGLGVLALLGGGAYFFLRWRRSRGEEEIPLDSIMTMADETEVDGASVFQEDGGQSIDTSRSARGSQLSQSDRLSDFSRANPSNIDTEEVDVIAEAEMYMTFSRDAQAEEVLLEAKQKDPKRYDIHVKLLEIYSHRKDVKQFEALAVELFSETGGVGEHWEKAAALGVRLDPSNSLYGGAAPNPMAIKPLPLQESTVVMPGELSQMARTAMSQQTQKPAESGIDFNIGMSTNASPAQAAPISLEITDVAPIAAPARDAVSLETTNIAPITSQSRGAVSQPSAPKSAPTAPELSLTSSAINPPAPGTSTSFSMSTIDLDLKAPDLVISEESSGERGSSLSDSFVTPHRPPSDDDNMLEFSPASDISPNEEVNTKLDLAKAYHDMGDIDGARELLREVVQEGSAEQKGKAQAMLDQLGA